MNLDNLFERAFDGFEDYSETPGFPGFPGCERPTGNAQVTDIHDFSRVSRFSWSKIGGVGAEEIIGPEETEFSEVEDRAKLAPRKLPGNPGNTGKDGKILAETETSLFPVEEDEPGKPGNTSTLCGNTTLDLNRAAPQRSDWWMGPAMAEVDRLAPPPGDPLPISAADVRAGVARELRALAEDGREGPAVLRDAVEITRAKIRNAPVLAERQAHAGRCHICGEPLDDSHPVVGLLQAKSGPLWLHHGECCLEHSRRRIVLVDDIMRAAGYAAWVEGESS